MKCPYCKVGISLDLYDQRQYPYSDDDQYLDENGYLPGFGIAHGWCPECSGFIVLYREGRVINIDPDSWYFRSATTDTVIYPKTISRSITDSEVPEQYRESFNQAAAVLDLSPMASAAISRRCLQHLFHDQFAIKSKSLAQEIDVFIELDHIPSYISGAVDAVRNIGNFAAHPLKDTNTGEIVDVEPGEADWLLEVLESLFDFVFIQPKRLEERKDKLNKKLKSLGKPEMKTKL